MLGRGSSEERPALAAHEALALALIASLPVMQLALVRVGGMPLIPADALFLATAATWGVALLTGRARLRPSRFYATLAFYAAAIALSAIFAENVRKSLMKTAVELYLMGLAVIAFNLARTTARLRLALQAWLVGTTVTVVGGVAGVVLFFLGLRDRAKNIVLWSFGSLPPGNYPRLRGFFENGNMLCNYLIVSAMAVLGLAAVGALSRRRALLLLAALGVTAAFTISPGLGGLALALGVWAHLALRGTRLASVRAAALASGVLLAIAFLAITSVSLAGRGLEPSSRLLAWQDSARTFLRSPLVGRGVGTEPASVHWVNPSGLQEHLTEAHNIWLSVAAQEGIIGLAAFASIVVYLLVRWRRSRLDGEQRALVGALGAAFIGAVLFQGLTGALEDTRHVWVLIGLLAGGAETQAAAQGEPA